MFNKFCSRFKMGITALVGTLAWHSPPWAHYLCQRAKTHPKSFWATCGGIVILLALGIYGYLWYQQQPKPVLVTAHITTPQITPIGKTLVPDSLNVDFGIEKNGFTLQSVAPLQQIKKTVTEGITLTPAMPGKWWWQSDTHLTFTPDQDWPAGQTYQVTFSKDVFAHGVKMASREFSFSTQPFLVTVSDFKFYQDPVNFQQKQAIATLNFNYPVNAHSLENNISLQLQALKQANLGLSNQHYSFTLSYDEHKRTAYLHSETLTLPEVSRYLMLTIAKGVQAITGATTEQTVTATTLLPDRNSFFKVNQVAASIVRNTQDKPEQILSLETTLGVNVSAVTPVLHVYLLPENYPATRFEAEKAHYAWKNPGEVTPEILAQSTPVALTAIPSEQDVPALHNFRFNAPTPRFIYVKLDHGVRSAGDYVLANDYVAILKVPEYPEEITFLHAGSLLALNGEQKLSVAVRGLPAVKFRIARILPEDVNQLVTQTQGTFNHPEFIHADFNQNNVSEIFNEVQLFNQPDPAKAQYIALDMGKYLATKSNVSGPRGLFLLQATGWDPIKKVELSVKTRRLILVTDLGLVVKDNNDGSHNVFVQSITTGNPVAQVAVSVLGKNGLPILTKMTDVGGHVSFPTLKDFVDEREPTAYLANFKDDVSFMPYNQADRALNYSRFDVGGQYTSQDQQALTAYVFSDRGIYRPGDTAHIGMIVKQTFAVAAPAGLPLEIMVIDPRGMTIKDQQVTLDATGLLTLDLPMSATALTGQYAINLYIVKDNHASNLLGTTNIRVAEFLPDRMRIAGTLSDTAPEGWVNPSNLNATVGLWNLYGAPAANRKIGAKIILAPERVQFKNYPDYTFFDPLYDTDKTPKVLTDQLPDQHTNQNGQAQFPLNLERFAPATYQLTFYAEGFEAEGGRSVTTQLSTLVSPLSYLIGYKADGDLNYIKQNTERRLHFLAVNPQLKPAALTQLTLQLSELHPVSTLVKNPDGSYQYQSLMQTHVINTTPFTIAAEGGDYELSTQQIGDFAISIFDEHHTELSHFKYSVVGESQLPLAKDAELTLKLNKSEYQPNETIELQMTAPYTGSGLITLERDRVYTYKWFKTNSTNTLQTIQLPSNFQGDGYVSVTFVRDWNSPEIFMNPLSYSVAPFKMTHQNHLMNVDLTTPAVAKPGEPFTIDYKSDQPGKVIIYAVDEGILQAGHYVTPDPAGYFFQKHALEVITQQTVDQILPKFIAERELSAVGGDAGNEAAANNLLNPFKRKTAIPVVYWSGIQDTDSTVRHLVYNVPDYFNGTLQVMAVAVAPNLVGSTNKSAEIRGDFVVNPNVPTFVAPGDQFEITASVANNVAHSGVRFPVHVTLTASPQLKIMGAADQTLFINEGQEQTIKYTVKADALLGPATLNFSAVSDQHQSNMTATLSVRPASAFSTSIMSASSTNAQVSLPITRQLYPEERRVEAVASTNPLILVFGLQQYLDNFPFGCTEQLVSKAWPLLALAKQPEFDSDTQAITTKIQATIDMLATRQLSSGGFSYWPDVGDNDSNSFASIYALHFLTEASAAGYNVPKELLAAGINYLKDFAGQDVSTLDDARLQAYAIYILTRNEMVTTNYLTHLQLYLDQDPKKAWRTDITSTYLAATYQLLKSTTEADELIAAYHPDPKSLTTDFYDKSSEDAQYFYLIARHFPELLPKLGERLIMPLVASLNTNEMNTVVSGYTSLALSAYADTAKLLPSVPFSLRERGKTGQEHTFVSIQQSYLQENIDPFAAQIYIDNPNKNLFFYQLIQSGFDRNLPAQAAQNGIEVFREYRDLSGKVITSANLGDEIEVHIQLRALNNQELNNIAVVDLLPGGFEVVNDSVHAGDMDYVDAREDRVIFFGSASPDAKEIVYHIKAVNAGQYSVPPIVASSMYHPEIAAHGAAGKMVVSAD